MVDFAFWHDAGKLSEKSFFGQDRLFFQSDRVRLQDHCVAGYDYARSRPGLAETAILILFHHEHWNGTGYFGLIGRDIPLACRLLAILDAYDVVRAGRSYSSSHSPRQAKALILAGSGSQFDPRLASATMNILQT
jgi:HD-GYP domain-containing protein (c-di-GMP phosphodiesterase class II)